MTDLWPAGPVHISICRCGVRLIAGDAVELGRRKGEQRDKR